MLKYIDKIASLQALFPLRFDKDTYLMNYLQDNDLCNTATWFTPLCSQYSKSSELESADLLTGSFSVCCSGIEDTRVKKYFKFSTLLSSKKPLL